ncbi:MAG: AI-2E family transporter [Burkholderiales bacterium]|nr:AI-2E family transporter [Burkholderiales bacterium]
MSGSNRKQWRWAGPFFALGTLALAIAGLRMAASLLIPIGIAILAAFLLTPAVRSLERNGIPRLAAVGAAVCLVLIALGGLGWVVARQTNDLLDVFPQYEGNLRHKLALLRSDEGSIFSKLRDIAQRVDRQISGDTATSAAAPPDAVKVTVVEPQSPLALDRLPETARTAAPAIGGTVLAFALLAFILMRREDLRERIYGLAGRARLPITTRAIDEATERITRTLLTQFTVNTSFGLAYGLGLYLIGIPFAPLWGLLAIALRYVPFIGAALAFTLPFVVSVLTMQGWEGPLLVAGWFVVLEIVFIGLEAWLIGPGIGVSPTATLIMLAFWTWLWGPIALLLATPLTACLMVIARFLPQFRFLEIALGDRPVLDAPDRLYQRLLSRDLEECTRLAGAHAHSDGLVHAYDELLLPALRVASNDAVLQRISAGEYADILKSARALIESMGTRVRAGVEAGAAGARAGERRVRILCIARDDADRIGHLMLQQVLDPGRFELELCSSDLLVSETVELIGRYIADGVCIGSMPPEGMLSAKLICRRLRKRFPGTTIIVARWGGDGRFAHERDVLRTAGASAVYTSIDDLRLAFIAIHSALQASASRARAGDGGLEASPAAAP